MTLDEDSFKILTMKGSFLGTLPKEDAAVELLSKELRLKEACCRVGPSEASLNRVVTESSSICTKSECELYLSPSDHLHQS